MEPDRQTLVVIDVDDVKHVNDCYGHDAGDMVLVCISNIMESVCRRHKVDPLGGEEFLDYPDGGNEAGMLRCL